MRPIKLIMTAFGPYKARETIDFSELADQRLFVISGNTGAGKTTIFDAICYALYGMASGDDRSEPRALRSHFAPDDVHTAVDFTFELRGRTYRVFRQLGHIKQGNKSETGERHELVERIGDQDVPLTDRQNKRMVDERLRALIGLNREQFIQIVMLPQGEFRKLLVSDTDNKEKILRNIFKTSLFKKLEFELDGRQKEARQQLDEKLKIRDVYIGGLATLLKDASDTAIATLLQQESYNTYQVLEALDTDLERFNLETRKQLEQVKKEQKELKRQMTIFHESKMLSEQFEQLAEKKAELAQLKERQPQIEKCKAELNMAQQAQHILVHDEHYQGFLQESERLQRNLEKANREWAEAEQEHDQAQKIYEVEEQRAPERERLIVELERLRSFRPAVEQMEQASARLSELEQAVLVASNDVKKCETELAQVKQHKEELDLVIKRLETCTECLPDKMDTLTKMREKARMLGDHIKLEKEIHQAQTEEKETLSSFEAAMQAYQTLEANWLEGQAFVLAGHLHDGEPCPVCGSLEHPNKAKGRKHVVPTKEELELQSAKRADAERAYHVAKAKYDHLVQQLEVSATNLVSVGVNVNQVMSSYEALVEEGKALSQEVQKLKADQQKLVSLRVQADQLGTKLDMLLREKEVNVSKLHQLQADVEKERALHQQSLASVPESLRSLQFLEREELALTARKQQLDKQWKEAQGNKQRATEKRVAARNQVESLKQQSMTLSDKLKQSKQRLDEAIVAAGFSDLDTYRNAIRSDEQQAELEQRIIEHDRTLTFVQAQIDELRKALVGKDKPDLSNLEHGIAEQEHKVETLREQLIHLQTLTGKLVELQSQIVMASEEVERAEARYSELKDLYDTMRGDNPRKISFERYLLIEFLDLIIEAADQRFSRMTGGQYMLVRSNRQERRGKQSGLALDVFDHYTGQYRDVKTLSGGEKFQASLCLALGMSDVIQSYEGGIAIETMFIDEGFGSLDEEALVKAVDALIDLQQSGRMVGVISHVAELKQAIPAVLEVTKTKEGSSRTRFVVS